VPPFFGASSVFNSVIDDQRGELIRTLGQARNLVIEVQCSPVAAVRVRDGQRLLVEIPAMDRQDGASRASPGEGGRVVRRASTGLETAQARAPRCP
jgi:hypothetical protein